MKLSTPGIHSMKNKNKRKKITFQALFQIYMSQYRVWAPGPISEIHMAISGLDQNTSEIGVKGF